MAGTARPGGCRRRPWRSRPPTCRPRRSAGPSHRLLVVARHAHDDAASGGVGTHGEGQRRAAEIDAVGAAYSSDGRTRGGDREQGESPRERERRIRGPSAGRSSKRLSTVYAVPRVRLDTLLADRGLFESRSRAAAAVIAGEVPPRRRAPAGREARAARRRRGRAAVDGPPPYVSRGGVKLANALDALGVPSQAAVRSTSARRPAASPTACSSAAPRT